MKKLMYLIVAIVILGFIVAGCIPMVPPSEQNESSTLPNKASGDPNEVWNQTSGTQYSTIQAAITAASAGDTINVGAGTYNENVVIDKWLTLQGAGSGDSPAVDTIITSALANTDVIRLMTGGQSTGERMVIQDLRVTGATGAANTGCGIEIAGGLGFITFDNVAAVFNEGNGIAANMSGDMEDIYVVDSVLSNNGGSGFRVPSGTSVDGLTLISCQVDNNQMGLNLYGGVTGLTVDGGEYNSNDGSGATEGVGIYAGNPGGLNMGFTESKPNVISNVTVSNNSRGIILWIYGGSTYTFENIVANNNNTDDPTSWGEGIAMQARDPISEKILFSNVTATGNDRWNMFLVAQDGSTMTDVEIVDSILTGSTNTTSGYGLWLWSNVTSTFQNLTISGCTISGNNRGIALRSISSGSILSDVNISGNTIEENYQGIEIQSGSGRLTDNSAHYNNIVGNNNYYGIQNYDTDYIFDATLNWWGDNSGPFDNILLGDGLNQYNPLGLGDHVSEYVLYDLWIGQDGMATGGGWFIAENNGNSAGITPGGKATFGFVAKQKNGTSSGQLEFQYQADDLSLKSTGYDWVSVSAVQAMFEGIGTINGEGSYRFRVKAVDGDKNGTGTDRFEIRIWTGGSSYESPVYRAEGDLGGGQIVVHKK